MRAIFTPIIFLNLFISFGQTSPSCSLDPVFVASNKTGIFPDSITNFIQGTVGQPYLQNITVKVPKDTTSTVLFCFNRVELSSVSTYTNFNLPPGLNLLAGTTVTTSAGVYKFPGNANSCSSISGIPTAAGTYTLQFKVQPYLSLGIPSCPATPNYTGGSANLAPPTNLTYYIIKINPAATNVGIKEDVTAKISGLTASPNPFSGKTTIKFYVKDELPTKITIYNILGDKVFEEKIKSNFGENSFGLNASTWSNGVYLYTVHYNNYSETKRLILNNSIE